MMKFGIRNYALEWFSYTAYNIADIFLEGCLNRLDFNQEYNIAAKFSRSRYKRYGVNVCMTVENRYTSLKDLNNMLIQSGEFSSFWLRKSVILLDRGEYKYLDFIPV